MEVSIKGLRQVQSDYKKMGLLIVAPSCTFKCEFEGYCKIGSCQNSVIANEPNLIVKTDKIIEFYKKNVLLKAIIYGGLEPFDSFEQFFNLTKAFRDAGIQDDVVFFTGYTKEELIENNYINKLTNNFKNVIIKYGRYKDNSESRYDEVLGVTLASNNQYAEQIS